MCPLSIRMNNITPQVFSAFLPSFVIKTTKRPHRPPFLGPNSPSSLKYLLYDPRLTAIIPLFSLIFESSSLGRFSLDVSLPGGFRVGLADSHDSLPPSSRPATPQSVSNRGGRAGPSAAPAPTLTDRERALLLEMQRKVADLTSEFPWATTDATLFRFLKARKWSLTAAESSLRDECARRRALPASLSAADFNYLDSRIYLQSVEPRPLVVFRPGTADASRSGSSAASPAVRTAADPFSPALAPAGLPSPAVLTEALERARSHADTVANPLGRLYVVMDLEGMGYRIDMQQLKQFMSTLSLGFPETLDRLFFINAPMMFNVIWKTVSPLVAPDTREKIVFVSRERLRGELTAAGFLPESLPGAWGGVGHWNPLSVWDPLRRPVAVPVDPTESGDSVSAPPTLVLQPIYLRKPAARSLNHRFDSVAEEPEGAPVPATASQPPPPPQQQRRGPLRFLSNRVRSLSLVTVMCVAVLAQLAVHGTLGHVALTKRVGESIKGRDVGVMAWLADGVRLGAVDKAYAWVRDRLPGARGLGLLVSPFLRV